MKVTFRLHIESGRIFAIDPYFMDVTPDSIGRKRWKEDLAQARTADEFISRNPFFALYDTGLTRGSYNFPLNAIRDASRHPEDAGSAEAFMVEKHVALIADVAYLPAILDLYDWRDAVNPDTWRPRPSYEGTLSEALGLSGESALVHVPAVGKHRLYEFTGEGNFYFNVRALTPAPRRRRQVANTR